MANARLGAYENAAAGKRSALQSIVGMRPGDMERLLRYRMYGADRPTEGEAASGAAAGGLGDLAKMMMMMMDKKDGDK